MKGYNAYIEGTMTDYIPTDEDLQVGFDKLPIIPGIQDEIKYVTEIRFTIPKGSFVNVYDFQELTTGNSE